MRWLFFKTKEDRRSSQHTKNVHAQHEIRCPLCGKRFQAGEADKCSTCSLAVVCGLVMCPNCSYEFVP